MLDKEDENSKGNYVDIVNPRQGERMNTTSRSPMPAEDPATPDGTQPDAEPPRTQYPADCEALVRKAELIISQVLRGGVLLSAAIIVCGVLFFYLRAFFVKGQSEQASSFPHTLPGMVRGLAHADPLAIIVLGLLVLLATPVVRVAVSIVAFLLERDWRYVVITSFVLLILLLSFFLGKGGA
jgi:uncharacterized membrane protein